MVGDIRYIRCPKWRRDGAGGARCGCQDRGGLRVPGVTQVTRLRGYATVSTKTTVADGRLRVTDRELRVIGAITGTVKYEYWYPNQETGYAYAYAYAYVLRSIECT